VAEQSTSCDIESKLRMKAWLPSSCWTEGLSRKKDQALAAARTNQLKPDWEEHAGTDGEQIHMRNSVPLSAVRTVTRNTKLEQKSMDIE
jgi:hypothetical protein